MLYVELCYMLKQNLLKKMKRGKQKTRIIFPLKELRRIHIYVL